MKKILCLSILFVAFAVPAAVTNITITAEVEIAGVGTNKSTMKIQQDGSKKDQQLAEGAAWAWEQYRITGIPGTNNMAVWLKDTIKEKLTEYSKSKQALDNASDAAKIQTLLTSQSDLLSTAQRNQLAAIAALLSP